MKNSRWYGWAGVLVAVLALVAVGGGVRAAWPGRGANGGAGVMAAPQAPAQGTPTPTPPVGATPSTTPGRTPVAGLLDGGNGNQEAPAADTNFVVWEDDGTGTNTWDIQGRDLSTGVTFDVNVDPADQRHPAISGDLV